MNIKKLTLIATAVSALSLSPLTYARTESADMSIIGIEPECSYFADLRLQASPFGSKGNIAVDKNSKNEFDKSAWGGNVGVGTEITPGFEVAVVASLTTNIGNDAASSVCLSSSSSTTTTPTTITPTTTSGIKLEAKHTDAYNRWLKQGRNPGAFRFLNSRLDKGELHKLFASQAYSIRGIKIQAPTNDHLINGGDEADAAAAIAHVQLYRTMLRDSEWLRNDGIRFYDRQPAGAANQDYCVKFGNLLQRLRDQLGNDASRARIANLIQIMEGDRYLNDRDKHARVAAMYDSAFIGRDELTQDQINLIKGYNYQTPAAANIQLTTALRNAVASIQAMGNALAHGGLVTITMYNAYSAIITHDCAPNGYNGIGVIGGARTAAQAYQITSAANIPVEGAVRELFYYPAFAGTLVALSDMLVAVDQQVQAQLDYMISNILANHKNAPEYKKLVDEFSAFLKQEGITDRTADEIIDAIVNYNKAQAQAPAATNNPATTGTGSTTTSTVNKPIDVNLTKFRVGIEGGVRLLEFGSGSLSIVAGVGATAVTGTVASVDTGYMWGADVYGGVKGEFAISESMAITARYTYTPALFGGYKLNDNVQTKVKSLGYADDVAMSSISMHELSAGIRFYF